VNNLRLAIIALFATSVLFANPNRAIGQDTTTGPVTNLPLPRYVSMKAPKSNVRRGPSLSHRIDWVYHHRNMPLMITAEHGHWRRVSDKDGQGGWIHYALLSGVRTVIVIQDRSALYLRPSKTSAMVASLEKGVIAKLEKCTVDWCRLSVDSYQGWAQIQNIWGTSEKDIRP